MKSFGQEAVEKWAKIFDCDISEFYRNPEEPPVYKTQQEQEMLDFLKSVQIDDPKVLEFLFLNWSQLRETEGDALIEAVKLLAQKMNKGKKKLK
ncbi:hypothetical protein MBAV_003498 [Candidatus Magnetobacterium bavaricum]|uniref:Uncharacterized protein n=1 Tax=Candidatus Magnetobacterium bavaricum TaxID=29290 RepID=A0A0F3GRC1_9BACT|nr:hypothetical protein MBAV_003498 [Candidatus Magnetobacterium bavaricum]